MGGARNIYGASTSAVFELSPNGNGGWTAAIIHTFAGGAKDGSNEYGTPVVDKAGNVYGTTYSGGKYNEGTMYRLSPGKKKATWTEKILHSFMGGPKDGSEPYGGVVADAGREHLWHHRQRRRG
ncbi:MAG: choice-of-anchor tandem repeat GloVer-containing protein [Terriglobales bacterium]|jgi:uncharacterized repeat protein (TIGR03803 family)